MVYYKRVVCDLPNLAAEIEGLRRKYNRINLYFPGHKKHVEHGLKDDKVLVIAHNG